MAARLDEATRRRLRGGRLLSQGKTPAEVARTLRVSRQSVYRWREMLKQGGIDALRKVNKGGRPPLMTIEEKRELREALLGGPLAEGRGDGGGALTVANLQLLIENRFGTKFSEMQVQRILWAIGFSCRRLDGDSAQGREQTAAFHRTDGYSAAQKNAESS